MDANDKKPAVAGATAVTAAAPEKKRGSTKSSRRAADAEKRLAKAMSRIAEAADDAMKRYTKRRDKSNTKRKDGGLMDMPENIIRASAKAASKATPAIGDMMKIVSTKSTRKALRQNLGRIPTVPFMG